MPDVIARRELLKIASATLMGLMGGGLSGGFPVALVQSVAKDDHWKPVFLNAQQDETVDVLTDLLIPRTDTPGARDAKVHRYVDLFLAVKDTQEQKDFVAGLAGLDAAAQKQFGKAFARCKEADQVSLLNGMVSGGAGQPFFQQAKTLTASIYFNTPEGYKELNKFGPPKGVVAGTVVC
jgi:hypothetical protein